jgi:hypothetical protein
VTLPNFLIVGAAKSGTTSLYEYLRQHPDVYMSPIKEPGYYCAGERTIKEAGYVCADELTVIGEVPVPTREEYEALFAGVREERAIGEATTRYLPSPNAAERIKRDLPDARIIISLRNPADRAYSSYLGRLRGNIEHRSVEEAMQPDRYYFATSLYYESLKRFYERFERIKVVLFDDLRADAHAVMRDLYTFLDVDPEFEPRLEIHNRGAVPRSMALNAMFIRTTDALRRIAPPFLRGRGLTPRVHPLLLRPAAPLPPAIRKRLLDEFRDDIEKTSSLIGRDLSFWC